jgi:hypothetical protein
MTETPTATVIAEVHDYDSLVRGLRQRISQLGTSFDVIDELLLVSPRYSAKVLSPRPSKFLSKRLFKDILSAAAVKLLLIEDPEQFAKVKDRLTPRSSLGVRLDQAVHIYHQQSSRMRPCHRALKVKFKCLRVCKEGTLEPF